MEFSEHISRTCFWKRDFKIELLEPVFQNWFLYFQNLFWNSNSQSYFYIFKIHSEKLILKVILYLQYRTDILRIWWSAKSKWGVQEVIANFKSYLPNATNTYIYSPRYYQNKVSGVKNMNLMNNYSSSPIKFDYIKFLIKAMDLF